MSSATAQTPGRLIGGSLPDAPERRYTVSMEPIRTDFKGYEGKFVALDSRTGKIVLAANDLDGLFEQAKGLDHIVLGGRVPFVDEPIPVGLG